MNHGHEAMYQHLPQHSMADREEMEMMGEGLEEGEYGTTFASQYLTNHEEDELADGMSSPRAVHQCNVCNKIFVSFKGLQQHSVIHTDQKPFQCDMCGKAFRFKSNLFEHRSVHTGFTPHACPYCGKTCRLKGNLKKHLKTHVSTKEELEEAWRPFASSNRRAPADIPEDAIVVRGTGESYFTPPSRNRKRSAEFTELEEFRHFIPTTLRDIFYCISRKMGLGTDARVWVEKIRRGELLPATPLHDRLRKIEDSLKDTSLTMADVLEIGRAMCFEKFECPVCKAGFLSRYECLEHLDSEHPLARADRPLWCETCLKSFVDRKSLEQHESYHKRVHLMMEHGDVDNTEPEVLVPDMSPNEDNIPIMHDDMLQ